eukprot:759030-Hanusia_phi.AAC.1
MDYPPPRPLAMLFRKKWPWLVVAAVVVMMRAREEETGEGNREVERRWTMLRERSLVHILHERERVRKELKQTLGSILSGERGEGEGGEERRRGEYSVKQHNPGLGREKGSQGAADDIPQFMRKGYDDVEGQGKNGRGRMRARQTWQEMRKGWKPFDPSKSLAEQQARSGNQVIRAIMKVPPPMRSMAGSSDHVEPRHGKVRTMPRRLRLIFDLFSSPFLPSPLFSSQLVSSPLLPCSLPALPVASAPPTGSRIHWTAFARPTMERCRERSSSASGGEEEAVGGADGGEGEGGARSGSGHVEVRNEAGFEQGRKGEEKRRRRRRRRADEGGEEGGGGGVGTIRVPQHSKLAASLQRAREALDKQLAAEAKDAKPPEVPLVTSREDEGARGRRKQKASSSLRHEEKKDVARVEGRVSPPSSVSPPHPKLSPAQLLSIARSRARRQNLANMYRERKEIKDADRAYKEGEVYLLCDSSAWSEHPGVSSPPRPMRRESWMHESTRRDCKVSPAPAPAPPAPAPAQALSALSPAPAQLLLHNS